MKINVKIEEMPLKEFVKNYDYAEKVLDYIREEFICEKETIEGLNSLRGIVEIKEYDSADYPNNHLIHLTIEVKIMVEHDDDEFDYDFRVYEIVYNTKTQKCYHP